jgi:3-deoxy-D-arabino-heptulosonate 7-phosphate (DAHP) synthase
MGASGCRRFFLCGRGGSCNSVYSSAPEFKNGTDGSLQIALAAMHSARMPHSFIGIDQEGVTSIIEQRAAWTRSAIGAMLESNLHEGTSKLARPPASLIRLAGHARLRPGCFPQPRSRAECVSLTHNA